MSRFHSAPVSALICSISDDFASLLEIGDAPTAPRSTPPRGVPVAAPVEVTVRQGADGKLYVPAAPIAQRASVPADERCSWSKIQTGPARGDWGVIVPSTVPAPTVGQELRVFRASGEESPPCWVTGIVATTQRGVLCTVEKQRTAASQAAVPATQRQQIPVTRTAPAVAAPVATPVRSIPAPVARSAQEFERVDAEGAARAAADEVLAKSLGFSPAPPVYQIGTVVNSIGVANFAQSREDWSKLPSLPELAKTFSAQIAAEQRRDYVVDAVGCRMDAGGKLASDSIPGASPNTYASLAMSTRALRGLATHVTPGGASYLEQCPPELRASNINHWLSVATQLDAKATKKAGRNITKSRQLTLRTRNGKRDRELFAVVGPKYASFDVDRVMTLAAEGIGGDARGDLKYDGYRMTLDAMFHSNIQPQNCVAGEFFKGTVRIQAADDGTGAIRVSLGLWRNLCRNLIIVDFDKVLVGSRRHVGQTTMADDIAELMKTANERIALIVGKWSEASTENVLDRYELTDSAQVIKGLVLNGAVKVAGVDSDTMVTRLTDAWLREPGYSKTAYLNAITRAAHEYSWSSMSDAEELESQAGALLYQPVWNLDISDRTAEEILA